MTHKVAGMTDLQERQPVEPSVTVAFRFYDVDTASKPQVSDCGWSDGAEETVGGLFMKASITSSLSRRKPSRSWAPRRASVPASQTQASSPPLSHIDQLECLGPKGGRKASRAAVSTLNMESEVRAEAQESRPVWLQPGTLTGVPHPGTALWDPRALQHPYPVPAEQSVPISQPEHPQISLAASQSMSPGSSSNSTFTSRAALPLLPRVQ
uniref:Uncharacterized protein n=1 Tax=Myotis myotis TaxID=51298 RepID=A0A7J7XZI8_MYOMY|nr:hypothetical protein mMyoMyo1_011351 [Myotis myotis]